MKQLRMRRQVDDNYVRSEDHAHASKVEDYGEKARYYVWSVMAHRTTDSLLWACRTDGTPEALCQMVPSEFLYVLHAALTESPMFHSRLRRACAAVVFISSTRQTARTCILYRLCVVMNIQPAHAYCIDSSSLCATRSGVPSFGGSYCRATTARVPMKELTSSSAAVLIAKDVADIDGRSTPSELMVETFYEDVVTDEG